MEGFYRYPGLVSKSKKEWETIYNRILQCKTNGNTIASENENKKKKGNQDKICLHNDWSCTSHQLALWSHLQEKEKELEFRGGSKF